MAKGVCGPDAAWGAECDAGTLARAEEIKADKKRSARAKKAATRLAREKSEEAKAMKKVAAKPKAKAKPKTKR